MSEVTRSAFDALDRPLVRHSVALALVFAALSLRLWNIGEQPLWLDEAMTLHIVHQPHGLDDVHNSPPLYYLLLRCWVGCFGEGNAALRSLSAVAGAGFVWATFHVARAAIGNRAAVAAAVFALLSPIHLYYSQEARAYSLMLAFVMAALWCLWRLSARVTPANWSALAATSAAALYTHYLAAIPLAIAYAFVPLAGEGTRRAAVRAACSAAGAAALSLLPWLLYWSAETPFESRDMSWLDRLWSEMSTFDAFADSVELLLIGAQQGHAPVFLKQLTTMAFPESARVVGLLAFAGLMLLHVVRLCLAAGLCRVTLLFAALFVGPLVALWSLSFVRPVYCPGRYDVIALPGLVLLLAVVFGGADVRRRPVQQFVTVLLACVLAVVQVAKDREYATAEPAPDRAHVVAKHLLEHARPADSVLLCGADVVCVLAGLYRDGPVWVDHRCLEANGHAGFACRLLPVSLESAPATATRYVRALDDGSIVRDLADVVAETKPSSLWVVVGPELWNSTGPRQAVADRFWRVLATAGYRYDERDSLPGVAHMRRD